MMIYPCKECGQMPFPRCHCPPASFYHPERIDQQNNEATYPAEALRMAHANGAREEQERLASHLAAQPPSQSIATLAADLGIADKLDAAWDALHPEDAGKPRGYAQQKGPE